MTDSLDENDGEGEGLPKAGYRHDFINESGKGIRFHLLEAHLPKNPTGEISELVRRKDVRALIQDIFGNSFRPVLEGEAEEIRNGADREDVAGMLEHMAEKFEEELLEEIE
jgi:hypothetical protein